MKRVLYILLCAVMVFAVFAPASVSAEKAEIEKITTPHLILYEAGSDTVLFEKKSHEKAYPASTTKIMTCIVALEYSSNVDAVYVCGNESVNGFGQQSSLLGLKPGYKVTIMDMVYGLMLCSGNDCGACLAYATSGSMDGFVALMNKKAEELGMTGTHYTNAHGLHNEEHYTTAYDMALLMKYALKNETFRKVISTKEYTVKETEGRFTKTINNSNKLIYTKSTDTENNEYRYAIGGKTGETNAAGYCLVAAAEKDGVTLITVLLGDNNQYTSTYLRFRNARKLFDYGFAQYVSYDIAQFGVTNAFNVQAEGYDPNDENNGVLTATVDITGLRISGTLDDLSGITAESFTWMEPVIDPEAVKAPVFVGTKVGTATLLLNGEEFFTGDLIAATAVAAAAPIEPDPTPSPTGTIINPGGDDNTTKSQDESGLTLSKNGGEAEFTVWLYYDHTLFTIKDSGLTWSYLFLDDGIFRAAKTPAGSKDIRLFRKTRNELGETEYVYEEKPAAGESYVIVTQNMAMRASKKSGGLNSVSVEIDGFGRISSEVTEDMVWLFSENGMGYNLISNGKYLHRSTGNGLLFWILIAILAIALAFVIYLLVTSSARQRNPKPAGRYKIYKM